MCERMRAWHTQGSFMRKTALLGTPEKILTTLSPAERLVLYVLSGLLAISAIVVVIQVNSAASVIVPARGGSLSEGVVGTPRFINPLLAVTQTDRDMTALVYSGLMRSLPDGSLIPDLASSYDLSSDGTTYTFHIRDDATFHDGSPLTAHDVAYTVELAQNQDIKSPRLADWAGVRVSVPDEHTVVFTLPKSYAPFLENTTLGILPKAHWEHVSTAEFPFNILNTHPIGSGPFTIGATNTDHSGIPTEYTLERFPDFALGAAHLDRITFTFFGNKEDLLKAANSGNIESFADALPGADELSHVRGTATRAPLERVFAVFFNQSHKKIFTDLALRRALDAAVDKPRIVHTILGDYGEVLSGPIPPNTLTTPATTSTEEMTSEARAEHARDLIASAGWKWDTKTSTWKKGKEILSFSLATADTPQLVETARAVSDDWKRAGVQVEVHVYPLTEFNTSIIRPRAYDAILFGEVVGPSLDLFAFWHSSQRMDPGLNLALYANAKADTLLATARATNDQALRDRTYTKVSSVIAADYPAVFLYAPEFVYVTPNTLHGVELGSLTTPSDRFANVYAWYEYTERVWEIFAPSNTQ